MERENKNQREVDKDGVGEIGQRTGWTALRAPSSPLCTRFFFLWRPNQSFPLELLPPSGTWGHSALNE